MELKKAIIVDLDGTLANIEERRNQLKENKDFKIFYSNIINDKINIWCREIINKFKNEYEIIIVTGREDVENVRKDTLMWLDDNNVYYDEIHFRKNKDNRKDAIIKEEIYFDKIKNKYEILFVVDDRKQVTEMWRKNNLICLQCDWGDF